MENVKTKYDNLIPDYDDIFNINIKSDNKKTISKHLLKKILKINFPSLMLSLFLFLFQNAPVYIVPIATSNIITLVTEAINNGLTDAIIRSFTINVIIMVFSIIQNVPATMLRWKVTSRAIRKSMAGVRCSVVRKLQSLSITYFKDMENGRIQSKYLKDTESIDGLLSNIYHGISLYISAFIITVIISVVKNGLVALFFLFIVPLNVVIMILFRKRISNGYKDYRKKTEKMSVRLNSMMDMMFVTKSHGLEEVEFTKVKKSIGKLALSGLEVDSVQARFGSTSYVLNQLVSAINLLFCAFLAVKKVIKVGDIILFQSMFAQISNNVIAIISSLPVLGSGMDAINSVSEIMNIKDVEVNTDKVKINKIKGNIRFDHVSYSYPTKDMKVIDDLSLDIKEGECIAVVGSSGSGKTTLMNMIIGFLMPSSGNVYIDDKNLKDLNLEEYRHHISVVPQSSILFKGSVKDNITYGMDKYSEEELDKVIKMANLQEVLDMLDDGINSDIGEHGDRLSGGQKQRITIARALIRNPRILIFDEATSALDNISEFHVQKAISSSIKGRTTFIVAHRLSTIRNASRIIVMEKGKIVETGTYEKLMERKGKFYELKNLSDIENKEANESLGG